VRNRAVIPFRENCYFVGLAPAAAGAAFAGAGAGGAYGGGGSMPSARNASSMMPKMNGTGTAPSTLSPLIKSVGVDPRFRCSPSACIGLMGAGSWSFRQAFNLTMSAFWNLPCSRTRSSSCWLARVCVLSAFGSFGSAPISRA